MKSEKPEIIMLLRNLKHKDASIKSIKYKKVLNSYSVKYREGKLKRVRQDSEKDLKSECLKKSKPSINGMDYLLHKGSASKYV